MRKKYLKFPPSLKLRRTSIFLSLFIIVIFSSLPVQTQICQASTLGTQADLKNQMNRAGQAGWGPGEPTGPSSLAGIIQTAISAFLGLLGIILIVLIIYAGYNWMTAQGDEEKVTKAKDTLTRAVIGLIIILAAYSITYFVFNSLSGTGGGNPVGGSGADATVD